MKRFLSITTVIFLLISLTACGKSDPEKGKRMAEIEENIAQKEAELEAIRNGSQKANEPYHKEATIQLDEIDIDSIDFLQVDLGEMISTLKKNPLKAQSLYNDKYVVIKGYFQYSLGDYAFSLAPSVDINYTGYVMCELLSEEQASIISSAKENEDLTVYGKVVAAKADDSGQDRSYYKMDVIKLDTEPDKNFDEIEFKELAFNDLLTNCKANEDTAEQQYMNSYIALTGTIGKIELDYFNICPTTKSGDIIYSAGDFAECEFTADEQKTAIAEMDIGDTVTVYGKITDIQPYYGRYTFHIDVMKIG